MKMLTKMLTSYIDKNHRTVPTFANRSQFTSGLRSVQQKVKSEFYKYTHQHFLPQEKKKSYLINRLLVFSCRIV